MRSAISLADALRAAVDLRPGDQATRDRILEMLGILHVAGTRESVAVGVWQQSLRDATMRPPPPRIAVGPAPSPASTVPASSPSAPADLSTQRRTRVRQVRQESTTEVLPAWLTVPGEALTPAWSGAVFGRANDAALPAQNEARDPHGRAGHPRLRRRHRPRGSRRPVRGGEAADQCASAADLHPQARRAGSCRHQWRHGSRTAQMLDRFWAISTTC